MSGEHVIWQGRESLWLDCGAVRLLTVGGLLVLVGIAGIFALVSEGYNVLEALQGGSIFIGIGIVLLLLGYFLFKRFSTYVITNKRIIEVKKGKDN